LKGTNFGVGPDVFQELTSGTQNTAIGYGAGEGTYGLTTGSGNVMIGYNLGGGCETGSNNTFLGSNTNFEGATYINRSIALGAGGKITGYNQFVVAPNVEIFNSPGLKPSTGSREGTLLGFDSSGNIIPSAGSYNSVSKIDTTISLKINLSYNDTSFTVTVTRGFVVESSSTNAYWYTNSEGVYYLNIHIHNKIDSSATSGTWIFGPLLGIEDNSGVDSTPNVTTYLNMLNSTRLGGGLHSIAYYPTNISPATNTNGIAVVLNFGSTPTNGAEFGILSK